MKFEEGEILSLQRNRSFWLDCKTLQRLEIFNKSSHTLQTISNIVLYVLGQDNDTKWPMLPRNFLPRIQVCKISCLFFCGNYVQLICRKM